ncbi:hypothetical protein PUW25_25275 (plasmid) [Paenibacillus urinalis]|uniref:Uncharacterized protein n=1 Tax=Paenibacillus urinalis TaxID=521520 RepID=A0ABY7XH10_9BACL|nr:hypothetical protein [Paenibacillus urinalis]WDI05122.1 hypothetical protein PUW25_25275 [Paenibacillus urinalis]
MYTQKEIEQWKEQYGEIFACTINEQAFVYRMLGRNEYNFVMSMKDISPSEAEEIFCEIATIYPIGFNFRTTDGYATSLCSYILDNSMLSNQDQAEQLLNYHREDMTDYNFQVDCVIQEAFPKYTLEEIASWPVPKTMYYLARAEWILQNLRGVPLQVYSQEELMAMQQAQATPAPMPMAMSPQQRAEASPLANPEKPPEARQRGDVSRKELSQQELEAMMSQVSNQKVDLSKSMANQSFPELALFKTQDDLRGEFDV